MITNTIERLLLLFFIKLVTTDSSIPTKSESKIIRGWNLYFHVAFSDIFHMCDGIFIRPEVYLTDAACIHRVLKTNKIDRVFINKSSNKSTNMKNINVDLTTGVYNEDLTNGYDESGRHIVILITGSQVSYDINEKFIELPKNIEDVDLSKCFLRQHDGYEATISPCVVDDNNRTLTCIYNFNINEQQDSGNTVMCNLKQDSNNQVLVGIWSVNKPINFDADNPLIGIENLCDLRDIIDKNLQFLDLEDYSYV